jgi:UDP-N-acetylmuramate--alanine ligase
MMIKSLPATVGTLHFVGIGGIGMSGIAEILHNLGYKVQGSDAAENANVKRLRDLGVKIAVGHDAANLGDAAVVVVSSAVKTDNPEVIAARAAFLPVVRRAEMLGELMRLKSSIAVGGTHGKTTTTSMVGTLLEEAGFDPTVINGGIVNAYGTNTRLGQGEWLVAEADESDGSFLKLPATVAVVTNIDPEHLDHFHSFDALRAAFVRFVESVPFYGFAVLCLDHAEVQALIPRISDRRIVTYGFSPQADVRAVDIEAGAEGSKFTVQITSRKTGEVVRIPDMRLQVLGLHNVQNSLAAIAIAHELGVKPDLIRKGLAAFTGVKRRFTRTGAWNGTTIIDDYGHHPVEIMAVLKAARLAISDTPGARIIAVVQPHRYTRLSDLFDDFCTAFNDADVVIVADVYAAGEKPISGADRDSLVEGLRRHGHRHVLPLMDPADLAEMVATEIKPNDYVICLGAGNITAWANSLPDELGRLEARGGG